MKLFELFKKLKKKKRKNKLFYVSQMIRIIMLEHKMVIPENKNWMESSIIMGKLACIDFIDNTGLHRRKYFKLKELENEI